MTHTTVWFIRVEMLIWGMDIWSGKELQTNKQWQQHNPWISIQSWPWINCLRNWIWSLQKLQVWQALTLLLLVSQHFMIRSWWPIYSALYSYFILLGPQKKKKPKSIPLCLLFHIHKGLKLLSPDLCSYFWLLPLNSSKVVNIYLHTLWH